MADDRVPAHPRCADPRDRVHQEWFEAGACDGFSLSIDSLHDFVDAFVDEVVPILQERGIFHLDYEGATLRENMHAAPRYGRDPRVVG